MLSLAIPSLLMPLRLVLRLAFLVLPTRLITYIFGGSGRLYAGGASGAPRDVVTYSLVAPDVFTSCAAASGGLYGRASGAPRDVLTSAIGGGGCLDLAISLLTEEVTCDTVAA